MKAFDLRTELASATAGEQRKATVVLLSSTVLMLLWQCVGSMKFYHDFVKPHWLVYGDPDFTAALYFFLTAFVLLGGVPLLIIKWGLRGRFADYGLAWGNGWQTLLSLAILAPPMLLMIYAMTRFPELAASYSINPQRGLGFGLHALGFALFYVGWEIHFRGFLQFGIAPAMGRSNAILVGVMASSLMHIGRPAGDMFGGILAGLLWGVLAFQTRSILSGMLQHAMMGLSLDFWLWLQQP
ncbi:CPBP family intramembrane glutamic endopeptidase [Roseimaritima ulvae]|uniref:CAAX prenyl protease 2/Lysostaphin resistance protein A-like domain-containing protein n=1 Tax=Roseimaritima ulvae TaxID=980254 RepID=A0A5B9QRU2_9BACT|nr:CPBP family intramembrane glutamic endopeptidase [Roseimaritima ulvae]QEG40629.1 hypothetical protein UC8_26460 [Roseimaritima ulvae]